MIRTIHCSAVGLFIFACAVIPAAAGTTQPDAHKYTLRYKFHPGQTLRWEVVHRSKVRTTLCGTTKTAETTSMSIKAWRVTDVRPDGAATFIHLVESVDMRANLTGRPRVRYNSRTDKEPPAGFADVAHSLGVPLAVVTMDNCGRIIKRRRKKVSAGVKSEGEMTIPLPEQPVPVGHTWSFPHEVDVTLAGGGIKRVKTLQRFTLLGVKTGVATIGAATQILTPIDDPAVEAQLLQRESTGTVRFDIDAGRILSQQMDLDKRVVAFRGQGSSLHCLTRFTEKLLPAAPKTADRPKAVETTDKH